MCILAVIVVASAINIINGFDPGAHYIPYGQMPGDVTLEGFKKTVSIMREDHDMVAQKLSHMKDVVNESISGINSAKREYNNKVSELAKKVTESVNGMNGLQLLLYNIASDMEALNTSIQAAKPKQKRRDCPVYKHYELLNNTMCVRLSHVGDKRTWQKSQEVCQADGGHLVTFMDEGEQKLITDFVSEDTGASGSRNSLSTNAFGTSLWIGLRKDKDVFKWITESKFAGKWCTFYPLNISRWNCVTHNQDGLRDALCACANRYICQIKLIQSN